MQTLNLMWAYNILPWFCSMFIFDHRISLHISTNKDLQSMTRFPVELWLSVLVCTVVIVTFSPFWMLLGLYDDADKFSPLVVWQGVWYGNPFLLVWVFKFTSLTSQERLECWHPIHSKHFDLCYQPVQREPVIHGSHKFRSLETQHRRCNPARETCF